MKKLWKRLSAFVLMVVLVVALLPGTKAYAGGGYGYIFVTFVTVDEHGNVTNFTKSAVNGASVTLAKEGTQFAYTNDFAVDKEIWFEGVPQKMTGTTYFTPCLWREEGNYEYSPEEGTYTVTDVVYPKGYVLDETAAQQFSLSLTVTKEQVEALEDEAWGGDYILGTIYIPIREKGTKSQLLKKPAKEVVQKTDTASTAGKNKRIMGTSGLKFAGGNYINESAGTIKYEIQFSTSKSGTYKKLCANTESTSVYFSNCKKVKTGKTYYFKARAIKKVGKKTIYGSWSSAKKLTVIK
jgi:hypothetical protein